MKEINFCISRRLHFSFWASAEWPPPPPPGNTKNYPLKHRAHKRRAHIMRESRSVRISKGKRCKRHLLQIPWDTICAAEQTHQTRDFRRFSKTPSQRPGFDAYRQGQPACPAWPRGEESPRAVETHLHHTGSPSRPRHPSGRENTAFASPCCPCPTTKCAR